MEEVWWLRCAGDQPASDCVVLCMTRARQKGQGGLCDNAEAQWLCSGCRCTFVLATGLRPQRFSAGCGLLQMADAREREKAKATDRTKDKATESDVMQRQQQKRRLGSDDDDEGEEEGEEEEEESGSEDVLEPPSGAAAVATAATADAGGCSM